MRERLKQLGLDKRYTFIAKVTSFSFKKGFINKLPLRTILFTKIMCGGEPVTDHVGQVVPDVGVELARHDGILAAEEDPIEYTHVFVAHWITCLSLRGTYRSWP